MKEEIKAGLIIVTSIIILTGFIILVGGSNIFEKYDSYYLKVMNAAGLEVGSQVRLGGVRAGRVLAINAPGGPGKPITIEIGVKKDITLYKGTKALITQIGFVGDIYLLLTVDNTTNEKIKPGDVILSEEQIQFSTIMARLDTLSQSVNSLIKDINLVFSQNNIKEMGNLIGNTNTAIVSGSKNLDKIANSLKGTTDKLQLVLSEVEDLMHSNKGEVSQMIKKAREDLDKAEHMIKAIEDTAKAASKTTKSIDKAIDLQSMNLDALLNSMTRTTQDIQDVLNEIKHKPWSVIYKEGDKKEE